QNQIHHRLTQQPPKAQTDRENQGEHTKGKLSLAQRTHLTKQFQKNKTKSQKTKSDTNYKKHQFLIQ
ncbi:hypothetical protein Q6298_28580, partial [Klebsiella pneumoniae]|uniref:hypothetical protein n=1 Tax=Klebsiella pneumoniae TaxID=573 RepID=UPI002732210B